MDPPASEDMSSSSSNKENANRQETWKEEKLRQTNDTLTEVYSSVCSLEERIDSLNERIVFLHEMGDNEYAREFIREKSKRAHQLRSMELTMDALNEAKNLLEVGKCRADDMEPVLQIKQELQQNLFHLLEENFSGRRG